MTNTVTINQQDLSPSQAKELVSENEELRKRLEELQHKQSYMMEEQLQTNNQAHEEELAQARRHEGELRIKVQRAERQASMLMHLTKATAKHDMKQIRNIVNDSVGDILSAEGARVFLIDEDTKEIWCPVHLPKARDATGSSAGDEDDDSDEEDGGDGDEEEREGTGHVLETVSCAALLHRASNCGAAFGRR